MKKIVVIDGQGGRMGKTVVEQLKNTYPDLPLTAIGTNSIATSAMLKAGADLGATGENPVITACRDADLIIGPLGIVIASSSSKPVRSSMAGLGSSRRPRALRRGAI